MSTHRDIARSRSGSVVSVGGGRPLPHTARQTAGQYAAGVRAEGEATAQIRADVARFFRDLRSTIGVDQIQAATALRTSLAAISALEQADAARLPAWPEVERIVMAYAAWAGIDARPVLTALGILVRDAHQRQQTARQAEAARPAVNASAEHLRHMRNAIAETAMRLPIEALNQARERPVRTFYALSLPLGLALLMLNTNMLSGTLSHVRGPFTSAAHYLHDVMAVHFAPEREGLRWIEVTDPRARRSDRLHQPER
ncbi:MAG: hypothetical protein R3D51_05425 [Hyphomicrobiaceae bacterium]